MRRFALILATLGAGLAAEDAPVPVPAAEPAPAPAVAPAPLDLAERLRLEAHGFVSFGYLRTWGNAWLGDTIGGTTEFHEAGLNVLARPFNRLRVGAQLFERDLVSYDNDRVDLDWAYADYRFADGCGVAVGRVKVPFGLYAETLDVDSARTPIFLPLIYGLRARDLMLTVDGGKVYGSVDARSVGQFEYALYAGTKHFPDDSGTVQYLSEYGGVSDTEVAASYEWGAMLHWNTPLPGLGFRVSLQHLENLTVDGEVDVPAPGSRLHSEIDTDLLALSAIYETRPLTVALEFAPQRAKAKAEIEPFGIRFRQRDDSRYGYLAVTWHARPWLDCYVACDYSTAYATSGPHSLRAIAAVAARPTEHLVLKVEAQQVDGEYQLNPADNRDGFQQSWQVLAFKATVDF
jgi:hypothetical protein